MERILDKEKAKEVSERISVMNRKYSLEKYFSSKGLDYKNGACSCPFHSDSTPSLKYDEDRGIWKCFACGRKGGYVKFVEEYENFENDTILNYYEVLDNIIKEDNDLSNEYGSIFYYEETSVTDKRDKLMLKLSTVNKHKPVKVETLDINEIFNKAKHLTVDKQLELCIALQNNRSEFVIKSIYEGKDMSKMSLMDLIRD